MNKNSITPLSGIQNLGATQTTPRLQTVSLSVKPGLIQTLKTVGTALYVSACYYLDEAGNRISTAANVSMNADSAFLIEAGTQVEFEVFDRPFNELHFSALADVETFIEIQIAYMLRVKNSSGGAGTASDLAHFQAQITEINAEITQINETLNGKQDALTFDNVPVNGSSNPVKSDGIYDALTKKLSIKNWSGNGKSWWQPDTTWILNMGEKPIHGIQKFTWDSGFETLFQKDKTGTIAFLEDLQVLKAELVNMIVAATGGTFAIEYALADGETVTVPISEENGEVTISEQAGDFFTADATGEITEIAS